MKFTLICCSLCVTLFSCYLVRINAEYGFFSMCSNNSKVSPEEKKFRKVFASFQRDLKNYCSHQVINFKCDPAVALAIGELPKTYKEKLVNIYLEKQKFNRKLKRRKALAAPDALKETLYNELDVLLRTMNFRELKFYDLSTRALWDQFQSLFLDKEVTNIEDTLRNKIDEVYNILVATAWRDDKIFITHLNPEFNVKIGLYLYFCELRENKFKTKIEGGKLTEIVIQSFKDEVIKFASQSLPKNDGTLVQWLSEYNLYFFKKAAQKESYVQQDDLNNLSDDERRNKIYRAFIKSYGNELCEQIGGLKREKTPREHDILHEYNRLVEIGAI